jgi:hypothetical protein
MKRKNNEETFVDALWGDWQEFKDYYQSGLLWHEAAEDMEKNGNNWLMFVFCGLYITQALIFIFLSFAYVANFSLLLCGAGIGLSLVVPFIPCWLLLRYVVFKDEQWKKHNE